MIHPKEGRRKDKGQMRNPSYRLLDEKKRSANAGAEFWNLPLVYGPRGEKHILCLFYY